MEMRDTTHYCADPMFPDRALAFVASVCEDCGQLHLESEPMCMPWSLTYFRNMTLISDIPDTREAAHGILNEGVTQEKSNASTEAKGA